MSKQHLGIVTKEGLEIKNLERFYSMEYGPDGGFHCDVYWNKKKICDVYQEGNGGCAIEHYYPEITDEIKISFKQAVLECLKRIDKSYSSDSEYEWLRNKTAENIDADDLEALECIIEDRASDINTAAKAIKEGYPAVCIIDCTWEKKYLKGCFYSTKQCEKWLSENHPELHYQGLQLITATDINNIL